MGAIEDVDLVFDYIGTDIFYRINRIPDHQTSADGEDINVSGHGVVRLWLGPAVSQLGYGGGAAYVATAIAGDCEHAKGDRFWLWFCFLSGSEAGADLPGRGKLVRTLGRGGAVLRGFSL